MAQRSEGNIETQRNKNSIPFKKNMSTVINISLWSLKISLGILTMYPVICIGLFPVVFHFKSAMFFPQISCAM